MILKTDVVPAAYYSRQEVAKAISKTQQTLAPEAVSLDDERNRQKDQKEQESQSFKQDSNLRQGESQLKHHGGLLDVVV